MLPVYSLASHGKHTCVHTKAHRHGREEGVFAVCPDREKNVCVCIFMHQGGEVGPTGISRKVSDSKHFKQCYNVNKFS